VDCRTSSCLTAVESPSYLGKARPEACIDWPAPTISNEIVAPEKTTRAGTGAGSRLEDGDIAPTH
jgi:hypothetical protein